METITSPEAPVQDVIDILDAKDCLQLLILEYGDIHIDTLATLLHLTSSVEIEFSHICAQRQC